MAATASLAASSAFTSFCSQRNAERQECGRGLISGAFAKCAWENPQQRRIGGRSNPLSLSSKKVAVAMALGKETSAASGVETQQWPIPQTIEEAIEQVTYRPSVSSHCCSLSQLVSRLGQEL